ncbi:MAG: ABC transporter ATP-binding protein [Phycisphaerae bacterium]|nr:ABC transporter ATP-binding protein [Phycisphaerae bacterium]
MTPSTRSADPPIAVRGVHKSYAPASRGGRPVEALRGAEMTIEEPGFYAVMGRSGSGKSTLLHLLAGLDRPESGEIIVGGTAVHSLGETDLVRYRRRGVGIVFQQFNLIPTLDALGNVMLPGLLDGMAERDVRERARALLHELNLADRSAHRPDTLSGGEQQRVAIARALLLDPPVVLADEPTGSLDSTTSAALWKLLEQTAQRRGVTVLMVTHEPVAASYCRRTFILHDGRVAGSLESHGLDPSQLAHRSTELARSA